MKLPLISVVITPLEWALLPYKSTLVSDRWYFLCFVLTVQR